MPDFAERSGNLKRTQHDEIQPRSSFGAGGEFEERLRVLGRRLAEHPGSVEDFVEEHRLTSARAAFVVGVAFRWLMAGA